MTTEIACFVAGVCAAAFVAIWFSTAYRELSEKRRNLESLREQLQLHRSASARADGAEREVARNMLSTNRTIFRDAADNYNRLLKKPVNVLPALLLGFRPVREDGENERGGERS